MSSDPFLSESPSPGGPSSASTWVRDRLDDLAGRRSLGDLAPLEGLIAENADRDPEALVRLIYEEVLSRREAGHAPETREVLARFPKFRSELAVLLDFDRFLEATTHSATLPEVGEEIGPFLLLEELGRGASGRTYLAREPALADRLVVVKFQPADQDEHLALARLQNTHILPLFSEQTFPERRLRGLCMPYLGGASLDRLLAEVATIPPARRRGADLLSALDRSQPRSAEPPVTDGPCRRYLREATWEQAVCWIAACMADALHSAHSRGLVHMDLKPSNVLIAADGLPLLLDFHLARHPVAARAIVRGRLGGTPGWMAPEQEAAFRAATLGDPTERAIDHRADLHALGLLLVESLDGPGRVGRGSPIATRPGPGGSVGLGDLIGRCLADDPADRYPDASAVADDLRRHLGDLPLRGVPNRSLRERWRKWRRRSPSSFARGLTLAGGFGGLLVALTLASAEYRQRVRDKDEALASGRARIAEGRHGEAVAILDRGLKRVRGLVGQGRAEAEVREELRTARIGQKADELHRLADLIRFRFGAEAPDEEAARALDEHFSAIWDDRQPLMDWARGRAVPGLADRVRDDLRELALVGIDAQARRTTADDRPLALKEALTTVEEARKTCGPSPSLSRLARALAAELGGVAAEDVGPPRNAREHDDLGRFELRSGRLVEALAQFERALEERPQDFWPNFHLGLCAYRLGRFQEAAAAFRVCEALSPTSPECAFNHALALEGLGKFDQARLAYSRALRIDPSFSAAARNREILSLRDAARAIPDPR